MESATGLIYQNGTFTEGSARVSRGRVVISHGPDPDAQVRGWILPKTVNCHTHLGDGFITRPEGCTVEELVAPPDGLKHRMLRTVGEERQVSCMRESMSIMLRSGTSHFIDFRESGLEGARRLLMASLGSGVLPVILGRPDTPDANEISALLSVADGIGLSSISDVDGDYLAAVSECVSASGKILALHASEVRRENIDSILGLGPSMLVHMIMAGKDDFERCASAGVPIAICPGSNMYFGLTPPLRAMLDAGATVCLGSDNAMLAEPDILCQLRTLRDMFPENLVTDAEMLEIAFENGGKVLNSLPGLGDEYAKQSDFFVLEAPVDEPFMSVLGKMKGRTRMFGTGGIP